MLIKDVAVVDQAATALESRRRETCRHRTNSARPRRGSKKSKEGLVDGAPDAQP
jgi:hypothetical protein